MNAATKKHLKKLLGAELRRARLARKKHLTQKEVAAAMVEKPKPVTYTCYELGYLEPSALTLLELADVLGLDLKKMQHLFRRERIGLPGRRAA